MEIKASARYDLDACKALTRLSMFKKADPKKRMIFWSVVYAVITLVLVWEIVAFDLPTEDYLMYFAIMAAVWILNGYMFFIAPRITYNAMGNMKGVENTYVFYDDCFRHTTNSEVYSGEAESQYTVLVRVYETGRYFFLYQTKRQVIIVDKQTMEEGAALQLRQKLSAVFGKKYIICRY